MHKLELYKDKRHEWRWRVRSSNGRVIGVSSEGYKNKTDCFAGVKLCMKAFESDEYFVVE